MVPGSHLGLGLLSKSRGWGHGQIKEAPAGHESSSGVKHALCASRAKLDFVNAPTNAVAVSGCNTTKHLSDYIKAAIIHQSISIRANGDNDFLGSGQGGDIPGDIKI